MGAGAAHAEIMLPDAGLLCKRQVGWRSGSNAYRREVVRDTDRMGKVQAPQLPHPNGTVPREDDDLGYGHSPPNGFGA